MMTVRSESRPPGAGVVELAQVVQHVGHLVAALPAAHVDDDVGVAPLGDLLQQHGLARAEATRNGRGAAARDREEHVEGALAGEEGRRAAAPLRVGPGTADRPVPREAHRDPTDPRDDVGVGVLALGGQLADGAVGRCRAPGGRRRRHPRTHPNGSPVRTVAPTATSGTNPHVRTGTGALGSTAAAPGPSHVGASASGRSSPSKTPPSRPGPSRADKRLPAGAHRVAGGQAPGVLVGLRGQPAAAQGHHLGGQTRRAQLDDLRHRHPGQALHVDQRPVDARDAAGHVHSAATCPPRSSTARSARAAQREIQPAPGRLGDEAAVRMLATAVASGPSSASACPRSRSSSAG